MHFLHRIDTHGQFALILHRQRRARLDAPFFRMARRVDEPGNAGGNHVVLLGSLEHVEAFLIAEGRMIDIADTVPDTLLDGAGRARMGRQDLVAATRLLCGHGHFFLGHGRFLGAHAGDGFTRQVELD